jgi:hypothetical protein
MEKKKILILAGIFLALLAVVLLLETPHKKKAGKKDRYLVSLDAGKVKNISIKKGGEETVLVKKGDRWVVENKDDFPADSKAVTDILNHVSGLETMQLVSRNPEKAAIFETDASGIEVKAEGEGTNAHFYVGKNGPDFNSNYVRREGSDEVYLSAKFIKHAFEKPDFRSRKIFDLDEKQITRMDFQFPDREIELVQDADANWKQVKGEPYNAKKDGAEALVENLKNLRIDDFVEKPEEKQFEKIQLEISFNCEDGYEDKLIVAEKNKDENFIFVKSASSPRHYKIYDYQINKFTDRLKDLKEEPPPPEKPDSGKKEPSAPPLPAKSKESK